MTSERIMSQDIQNESYVDQTYPFLGIAEEDFTGDECPLKPLGRNRKIYFWRCPSTVPLPQS